MEYLGEISARVRRDLTPRSANPAARHQRLPKVLWFLLLRGSRPRPHPVAFMEQLAQGLSAPSGGPVKLCTGAVGWVMVDQNLTGDHGRGRELARLPVPSIHLFHKQMLCKDLEKPVFLWVVLQTGSPLWHSEAHWHLCPGRANRDSLLLHPSAHVQEPLPALGVSCTKHTRKAVGKGGGSALIHYVLQADQSASLWNLPHKLLWTWFKGWKQKRL